MLQIEDNVIGFWNSPFAAGEILASFEEDARSFLFQNQSLSRPSPE